MTTDEIVPEFDLEETPQLREELNACKHFFSDSEMENGRQRVFNYKIDKLDANEINENLRDVFEKLTCAAKNQYCFWLYSP